MSRDWLPTLLGLLSGAWLPTGSGRPGTPAAPAQPWAAVNQTQALVAGARAPLVPALALGSWKAFLGLQKLRRLGTDGQLQEREVATSVSLPLDPREVTEEMCRAVPFIQVLSRPGCTAVRVRNHLCFGRCSSLYIPDSDPRPLVLCNSCAPTRQRWTSVVLRCQSGSPASPRRVKMSTMLVEGCQCRPKLRAEPQDGLAGRRGSRRAGRGGKTTLTWMMDSGS
ncbi:DAN domain family member 5 [Sciurus carolinensis]|uniref:DAN domain family member 5 n=1 Tax=Sciurus carolinensis TaxID=30640 RepID=UPI001FB4A2A1|nr:DAN domain family member 5 [Sciurus carolinensis]